MLVQIFAAVSNASNHFVEFIAVMPFGNVLELASEKIAVLFEEIDVPVARIRQNHGSAVFPCEVLRRLQKRRAQALMSERFLHKERVHKAVGVLVHVRDHAGNKPAVFVHELLVKINALVFRLVGFAVCPNAVFDNVRVVPAAERDPEPGAAVVRRRIFRRFPVKIFDQGITDIL